jgi:hypothetical protein
MTNIGPHKTSLNLKPDSNSTKHPAVTITSGILSQSSVLLRRKLKNLMLTQITTSREFLKARLFTRN